MCSGCVELKEEKFENKFSNFEFCDFEVFDFDLLRKTATKHRHEEVDFADAKSLS